MRFDIITIFPDIFDSYFNESIIGRAQKKRLVKMKTHDLRKWTTDKHRTVDDRPYGGGVGMILKVEPIFKAIEKIKKTHLFFERSKAESRSSRQARTIKGRIILFSAKGKTMTQADIRRWAKYDQLILICGRYEGVDERVAEYIADEEVYVGNYVLTGGEIPAMIVVDAVSRLVAGVLGKKESLKEESFGKNDQIPITNDQWQYLKYPQYTRPEEFRGWKVPRVLLGGNHRKIQEWKQKHSKVKL